MPRGALICSTWYITKTITGYLSIELYDIEPDHIYYEIQSKPIYIYLSFYFRIGQTFSYWL